MKKTTQPTRRINGRSKPKSGPVAAASEPVIVENPRSTPALVLAVLIVAVLAWSYGPSIRYLAGRWWNETAYSYGFLVPLVSGYLLWHRRSMIAKITFRGSLWGLLLLAAAAVMRWSSSYLFLDLPDPLSLVPCLAGVALLVGGWPALRWSWPAIVFLGFMLPFPGRMLGLVGHSLQQIGAVASTFVIQLLGIPSVTRGNVIVLPKGQLVVAEGCNALPLMMLFFAVSFVAVFVLKRTWVEKVIILACAAPIAILANIVRIVAIAIVYEWGGAEFGQRAGHDLVGWFMMPLAVVFLWILLWFLDHALVSRAEPRPMLVEDP